MTIKKSLGEALSTARKEKGLSQKQVADKMGINVSYYANIEQGARNITIGQLEKILKAIGIKSVDFAFKLICHCLLFVALGESFEKIFSNFA